MRTEVDSHRGAVSLGLKHRIMDVQGQRHGFVLDVFIVRSIPWADGIIYQNGDAIVPIRYLRDHNPSLYALACAEILEGDTILYEHYADIPDYKLARYF